VKNEKNYQKGKKRQKSVGEKADPGPKKNQEDLKHCKRGNRKTSFIEKVPPGQVVSTKKEKRSLKGCFRNSKPLTR